MFMDITIVTIKLIEEGRMFFSEGDTYGSRLALSVQQMVGINPFCSLPFLINGVIVGLTE